MMKAIATRTEGRQHSIAIRDHELTIDENPELGGIDSGPTPLELLAASLAGCVAVTVEMYADRKGWDVGKLAVDVEYAPAERGVPTKFAVVLTVPSELTDEQVERLSVIAAKCPVHRMLDGEVMFDERVERTALKS
ncbi:MAG: OsmC family protein [Solirubrobacteraceae bacterium]|jgi:putative redox protein|nr:OsmC family protein [Solirubrobacteraceae bacterium]MDP4672296.1 OsmC family protein [Solirubrobacteraceae bacterium]MDP5034149.1 OsmC family protein [Solirubrobacteraceae bacterium]